MKPKTHNRYQSAKWSGMCVPVAGGPCSNQETDTTVVEEKEEEGGGGVGGKPANERYS